MKTIILALSLLLFSNSDCQIAFKIPFPESEYKNKRFNRISYKDVDNWVDSDTRKELPYQTHSVSEAMGKEELIYAWCTNLDQFVLVAVHNQYRKEYYKYNPIFLNVKIK